MNSPTLESAETSFKKLKDAGAHILITQWDISILPRPYKGANISANFNYSKEMDPYREEVLFDRNNQRKPVVEEMIKITNTTCILAVCGEASFNVTRTSINSPIRPTTLIYCATLPEIIHTDHLPGGA